MRIPVLIALSTQEPIRESASAAMENRVPKIPLAKADIPKEFLLDESFSAIPIGLLDEFTDLKSVAIDQSADFVIRAFFEAESVEAVPDEVSGTRIFADPLIEPFAYCGTAAQGTIGDVKNALNTAALSSKQLDGDGVAVAVVDTGINLAHLISQLGSGVKFDFANSWRPTGLTTQPGSHSVGHGTMCAYNVLAAAPKATLIDVPALSVSAPGGTVTGRSLSTALQAFSYLLSNYAVAFAPGGIHQYKGLVITNSWGIYHPSWDFPTGHPGRYCDNPQHPFASIVKALTSAGADIAFAAGNCGEQCPNNRCQSRTSETIMGANSYAEVLTVAACLVTNQERLGYSSQGPSIAGMPMQNKPDLTGFAHFIGSKTDGNNSPDSGTSTACPIAAGCVAALRSRLSPAIFPPANLIAQLQGTAKQPNGTASGWNADYGWGIIDPLSCASSLGL